MARRTYLMVDLLPTTAYWRGIIAGVSRFTREHSEVQLRMPSSEWALIGDPERIDAVISVVPFPDPAAPATRFGKPVVNVSSMREDTGYPTVTIDNYQVGRLAADHLLNQGYHHFAFHMESRVYFSCRRLDGFRNRLAEAGRPCHVFDTNPETHRDASALAMHRATLAWLAELPKPLGLFTHNDGRAAMLMDLCRDANLAVPEQVGVLGGDNDELLALSCPQPLSSIDTNAYMIGYRAACLVMDILDGHPLPTKPVLIPPRGVVQRRSTQPVVFDDDLVSQAVRFIREHATDPIDVEAVLREVPLSRRSLERRFRELLGRTPRDEIVRVQVERAQWLLAESDHSLKAIAQAVGYTNFRSFATAFKRTVGTTPLAYRKQMKFTRRPAVTLADDPV